MISYTVTTKLTQGQYEVRRSSSLAQTWLVFNQSAEGAEEANATSTFLLGEENYDLTEIGSGTSAHYTGHHGDSSYSFSNSGSTTATNFEFSQSGKSTSSESATTDSNLAATQVGAWGNTFRGPDNDFDDVSQDQFSNNTTLTPTTISVGTSTTSMRDLPVRTTETQNTWSTFGTTTQEGTGTATTAVPTTTQQLTETTVGTMSVMPTTVTVSTSTQTQTQFVTFDNNTVENTHPDWDAESTGFHFPPRDTATVFQEFQTECVWLPTASDLPGAGPWSLTDIAASFASDTTAKPGYFYFPLKVVDATDATFPEPPENLEIFSETITTSTIDGSATHTVWRSNTTSGFPLISTEIESPKITTTNEERTNTVFTENNPALTEPVTLIDTQAGQSAEVKNFGLTYQEFFSAPFETTRYAGTWSESYLKTYEGASLETFEEDDTTKSIFYTNITVNSAEGVTIFGTNVERIQISLFSPAAVSHNETSFTDAWGLHGSAPQSLISTPASLSWKTFAEIHPGVSVPYPSSTSWTTGATSLSASILGNAITVTTSTGSGSEGGSTSSTYQFEGEKPAHTEQLTGREFFTNLRELPALTVFGPHAATGSVETRARPGTYVQISQDSLGDYTLNTLTLAESSAATISQNAILYPAEQSFYTSTGGEPFLVLPRNPTP
jgi:hypothetical protein